MNIIEVRDLTKKYGDTQAVDGISFDVREGELFAFLGENGAGKSTTINIICTILSKTSGEVRVCSHVLGKEDDKIRKEIGIVFQNSVLDDVLTVEENLYSRGSYYGLNKKQIKERIMEFYESKCVIRNGTKTFTLTLLDVEANNINIDELKDIILNEYKKHGLFPSLKVETFI